MKISQIICQILRVKTSSPKPPALRMSFWFAFARMMDLEGVGERMRRPK
jgi:hypothetical protein